MMPIDSVHLLNKLIELFTLYPLYFFVAGIVVLAMCLYPFIVHRGQ